LAEYGIVYNWLWVPIYMLLWRIWEFIEQVKKFYEEMPDK